MRPGMSQVKAVLLVYLLVGTATGCGSQGVYIPTAVIYILQGISKRLIIPGRWSVFCGTVCYVNEERLK